MGEQNTKAMLAGGLALFVTGLVVLALFVIPAARHTQVAMAQDDLPPDAADPGAEPMAGGEEGAPGMEGGAPPGGAPAAAASAVVVEPLEPSRPNPFEPRAAGVVAQAAAVSGATSYGPNWSNLPIGESMGFIRPEIPSAPEPPPPVISAAGEAEIRITSILWDASGQAQAAYETAAGRSGVLKPGDRIQGSTVVEITRSGVTLRNDRTGAVQTLELRARTQRPAPSRRGGTTRGGTTPQRGFPAAPPG